MKYFSHDCDAGSREWLSMLHEKFGHEGYSLWFQILEILGKEIDKEFDQFQLGLSQVVRPIMKIGLKWLSNRVKSSEKAILEFIDFCEKHGKYSVARHSKRDGTVTIEVPNFLRSIDEYARKTIRAVCKARGISPDSVLTISGQTPDNVRTLSGQKRREEKRSEEKKREGGRASRPETAPQPPDSPPAGTPEPAPPGPDSDLDSFAAPVPGELPTEKDLEDLEVACDVQAFAFCHSPGPEAKRKAILDLRRLGRSHEYIRHAAGLEESLSRPFYAIVRDLEHERISPPFKASPSAPKPSVLSSDEVRARLIAAQDEADRRLGELPPEEVAAWTREEEEAAARATVPKAFVAALVKARLRLRVAEKFGIEGLTSQKETV